MRACEATSSQPAVYKAKALAELQNEMREAHPRRRLVFGEGDPDALLAIVGEAPGREEEALGRPFVGRAGQLLTRLLEETSLDRGKVWVTNVVKSHPTQDSGGRTRTPSPGEARTDRAWLARELEIISPRLILCLGLLAARALLGSRFRMSADHGRWFPGPLGAEVLASYHPSYVLRWGKRGDQALASLREDLRQVKSRYAELRSSSHPSTLHPSAEGPDHRGS